MAFGYHSLIFWGHFAIFTPALPWKKFSKSDQFFQNKKETGNKSKKQCTWFVKSRIKFLKKRNFWQSTPVNLAIAQSFRFPEERKRLWQGYKLTIFSLFFYYEMLAFQIWVRLASTAAFFTDWISSLKCHLKFFSPPEIIFVRASQQKE